MCANCNDASRKRFSSQAGLASFVPFTGPTAVPLPVSTPTTDAESEAA